MRSPLTYSASLSCFLALLSGVSCRQHLFRDAQLQVFLNEADEHWKAGNGCIKFITASVELPRPVLAINQRTPQLHHIAAQHGGVLGFPLIQARGRVTFAKAFARFERGADIHKHDHLLLTIQPPQRQTVFATQVPQYCDELFIIRWKFLVQYLAPCP